MQPFTHYPERVPRVKYSWSDHKPAVTPNGRYIPATRAEAEARRVIKSIGALEAVVSDFDQATISRYDTTREHPGEGSRYTLRLLFLGLPEDTPAGTVINLAAEPPMKTKNLGAINETELIELPGWWTDRNLLFKGPVPPELDPGWDLGEKIDLYATLQKILAARQTSASPWSYLEKHVRANADLENKTTVVALEIVPGKKHFFAPGYLRFVYHSRPAGELSITLSALDGKAMLKIYADAELFAVLAGLDPETIPPETLSVKPWRA